ncbi:MAG: 50S ribosomal protein L21 [Myxococcales bacterium]|nr:50S ribosomal protein L21 [Myxococcales bacterium]MCB9534506.1 50S ribosomal protein L21 [Myxococcales bacterium]
MYAVIRTGGKQYRVKEGEVFAVERLEGEPGSKITFSDILAVGDGSAIKVGKPTVAGATVTAEILLQARAKKILVFKFKRRRNYKRTRGHRQYYTRVRVTAVNG